MKSLINYLVVLLLITSCSKDFLEEKSNQKLLVPNTLEDFQLLLDNHGVMNRTPGLGMIAGDDFFVTDAGYGSSISEIERAAYIWNMKNVTTLSLSDWNIPYEQIFYSNVVLDGLENLIDKGELYNEIMGSALFYRSYALFGLLQEFAEPYQSSVASAPSVPLSLNSDINKERPVVTIQIAYKRMIDDLLTALTLLPDEQTYKTRPSRLAVLSLLGRIYLLMGEYGKSEEMLEKALDIRSELIDYNTLSASDERPFPTDFPRGTGNAEVVFYSPFITYSYFSINNTQVRINPELYQSYVNDDLRRALYFLDRGSGIITFKGSYSGPQQRGSLFSGLSTDENYLNFAEALVRNNKLEKSLEVLNSFLVTRFKSGHYQSFQSDDKNSILDFILIERRKSLIGKGTRWFDIRRFINDQTRYIPVEKIVEGTDHELNLNDVRVTFPFPANE